MGFEGGDVFGDGVNVASRIEPLAEPGGICVSGRVYDDIQNKPDIETTFIGEQTLKGVARPIKVYALTGSGLPAPLAKPAAPGVAEPASKRKFQYFNLPAALIGGVILAALGYVFLLVPQLRAGAPIPIAVVDFVNETSEPELDGLSGMLITSLEQSQRLAVLTRSRMFDILKQLGKQDVDHIDETLGKEIARQAHLDVLIIASIRKLGRLYIIDLKALVPDRDEYLFTAREEGEGQESILTMLDRLAEKTRVGLKEKLTEIRATSLRVAEVTTPNLEAYQHYFKGEALINKLKFEAAQEEFEKAIAIDTTFGLAYYRLAYAISWIMGSEQLAIEPIRKAFAYIDRVPDKVKYLLRAEKALVEEGMEAGIAILKEMERIYPDDKEMLYNIGDWSYHVGDETTAIEYLDKVLAMDPTNERALQHLSWAFRDLEQFDKMMEVERRFVAANKVEGNFLIGENYYHQGEYTNAAEYLEKVLTIEPTHREAVLHLIWAYRDLEQTDKLLEVAKSYSSVEEDSALGYRMLGDAYRSLKVYGNAISNY